MDAAPMTSLPRRVVTSKYSISDPQTNFEFDVRRTVNPELVKSILARYRRQSEQAVATLRAFEGLYYDPHNQQKLDVWGTSDALRPVFMAIHGGY